MSIRIGMPGPRRAQPPADLHAVEPRQHEVEHDEVERIAQPGLDAGDAVADRGHVVAVARQQIDDAVPQAGFVFDHEDAHAPHCVTPACKARVRPRRKATPDTTASDAKGVARSLSSRSCPRSPPRARGRVVQLGGFFGPAHLRRPVAARLHRDEPAHPSLETRSGSARASRSRSGSVARPRSRARRRADEDRATAACVGRASCGSSRASTLRIDLMPQAPRVSRSSWSAAVHRSRCRRRA